MFILKFIPEPWASAIVAGALFLAYLYGSVTGTTNEHNKNLVKQLSAQNKVLTQDLTNASRVQAEAAQEASDARAEVELLNVRGKELEALLKNKSRGACNFTPAERLRIQRDIPIHR